MLLPCKRRPPSGSGEARIAAQNQMSRVSRQPRTTTQAKKCKNKKKKKKACTRSSCGLTLSTCWRPVIIATSCCSSYSVLVHTRLLWTFARVRRNIPHTRSCWRSKVDIARLCLLISLFADRETGRVIARVCVVLFGLPTAGAHRPGYRVAPYPCCSLS